MQQSQLDVDPQNKEKLSKLMDKLQSNQLTLEQSRVEEETGKNIATISREVDNFYCDLALSDKSTLKITLTSQLDASVYLLVLDPQSKKQHQELNFFQSNEEIFEYIQQNWGKQGDGDGKQGEKVVQVDQKGKLTIRVISSIGKKARQRTINLQTNKVKQNKETYLQNVVKKISKTIIELRKQVASINNRQTELQNKNAELTEKVSSYGVKIPFFVDKNDSHFAKFKQTQKRVTKLIDDTTYFSLFSDRSIPKSGNSYFNIQISHSQSKNIMIGLGSKFIKGIPNVYSHADFIGLYLYGQGYVWQKGNQRDINLRYVPVQDGITVTTNINMNLGFVCWQICGLRVASSVLPLQLKAKLLYPVVLMVNVSDCIDCDR